MSHHWNDIWNGKRQQIGTKDQSGRGETPKLLVTAIRQHSVDGGDSERKRRVHKRNSTFVPPLSTYLILHLRSCYSRQTESPLCRQLVQILEEAAAGTSIRKEIQGENHVIVGQGYDKPKSRRRGASGPHTHTQTENCAHAAFDSAPHPMQPGNHNAVHKRS